MKHCSGALAYVVRKIFQSTNLQHSKEVEIYKVL